MAESYCYSNSYCYNNFGGCDYYYDQSESTHFCFFGQYDHSVPHSDGYSYDISANISQVSDADFTFSEPNYVEYDPNLYYAPAQNRFVISYSVSEFSVPEFEEYDPTPYGGGYDLAETYGKPLPPSDEICYPKSLVDQDSVHLNDFTFGSIKSPYGNQETVQPEVQGRNGSEPSKVDDKPVESAQPEDKKEDGVPDIDEDSSEGGSEVGYGNGSDHGGEFERRVNQIPSGYGLETFDICESLFGYWPCLDRMKRGENSQSQSVYDEWSNDSQWNGTADYLFGASNPYGEHWDREGNYHSPMYAYQTHYQEQPLFAHIEYEDRNSWL